MPGKRAPQRKKDELSIPRVLGHQEDDQDNPETSHSRRSIAMGPRAKRKKPTHDETTAIVVSKPNGSAGADKAKQGQQYRTSALQAPTMLLTGHLSAVNTVKFHPNGASWSSTSDGLSPSLPFSPSRLRSDAPTPLRSRIPTPLCPDAHASLRSDAHAPLPQPTIQSTDRLDAGVRLA